MSPKKLIQAIGDSSRSRQERMYRLLVMLGLPSMAVGIAVGILSGKNGNNVIVMTLAFVLLSGIVCLTVHYRKIQSGAVIIACLIIFFVLPYNFLTSGGIYGGAPTWFLFGVVLVCLIVERKIKYFLIAGSFFVCAVCYYIAYYYPELTVPHTIPAAYIDSFASLSIVTVLTCSMILFQNAICRSENETTQRQKNEIEKMNQAQNRFFSSMSHEIRTPLLNDIPDMSKIEAPVLTHRKKMPIIISTDSVCDLPKEFTERHQIIVMPYRVVTEGGEFMDGVETEAEGILLYIREQGKIARSECPRVEDYEDFFADLLTKAQYIIHIAMARNVSQGYANALEASKIFDNVVVVDSGHLSSGMGLMILRAARYAAEGMTADAIVNELDRMKPKVRTSFIVDSTEYLARVGRISSRIDTICRMFMLHPVIVLKNSSMKVGSIRMGTRDSVRRQYITSTLNVMGEIDRETLFITYAGLTGEELKEIEEQVKSKVNFKHVIYQKASSAITTNCGPGSFGLLFMMHDRDRADRI